MLIIYSSTEEVLICDPDAEKSMLSIWFEASSGRDLDYYDREECPSGIVVVNSRLAVDFD